MLGAVGRDAGTAFVFTIRSTSLGASRSPRRSCWRRPGCNATKRGPSPEKPPGRPSRCLAYARSRPAMANVKFVSPHTNRVFLAGTITSWFGDDVNRTMGEMSLDRANRFASPILSSRGRVPFASRCGAAVCSCSWSAARPPPRPRRSAVSARRTATTRASSPEVFRRMKPFFSSIFDWVVTKDGSTWSIFDTTLTGTPSP